MDQVLTPRQVTSSILMCVQRKKIKTQTMKITSNKLRCPKLNYSAEKSIRCPPQRRNKTVCVSYLNALMVVRPSVVSEKWQSRGSCVESSRSWRSLRDRQTDRGKRELNIILSMNACTFWYVCICTPHLMTPTHTL